MQHSHLRTLSRPAQTLAGVQMPMPEEFVIQGVGLQLKSKLPAQNRSPVGCCRSCNIDCSEPATLTPADDNVLVASLTAMLDEAHAA